MSTTKNPPRYCKECNVIISKRNKYDYCRSCYNNSPEIKKVSEKIVNNRPSYDGESNPNYRGKKEFVCPCEKHFFRRVSPSQEGTRFHTYCSTKCKKKYSISKIKMFEYKELKLRSSWELAFAQYLDSMNYTWDYEPESFDTSHGFYTPDFWVKELNSYIEVKGYFRDQNAKDKFEEFSKTHSAILADLNYFKSLGYVKITSGPRKGQLCPPAAQL